MACKSVLSYLNLSESLSYLFLISNCHVMILHYILVSSSIAPFLKLLPWLQYLEDGSQAAVCKEQTRDELNSDPQHNI